MVRAMNLSISVLINITAMLVLLTSTQASFSREIKSPDKNKFLNIEKTRDIAFNLKKSDMTTTIGSYKVNGKTFNFYGREQSDGRYQLTFGTHDNTITILPDLHKRILEIKSNNVI